MLGRLVLGYVVVLPFVVFLSARSVDKTHGYTVSVTMQTGVPGYLQVFYDDGDAFSESRSSSTLLQPSDAPHDYRLGVPRGRYRSFRIDPGTSGGRYIIQRVSILAPDGSEQSAIPLQELVPAHQVSMLEQTANRVVLESPSGSNDPQLVYSPSTPLVIPDLLFSPPVVWVLIQIGLLGLCGAGFVWLIELGLHRSRGELLAMRAAELCDRHRQAVVCLVAVLSTVAATYPVLFFGRSLVAPNNHGTPLLYGEAPYAPGSTDLLLEDVRGSDVWAAVLQEVPHAQIQREALATGEIPLWNRYNAGGRPLWAQGLTSPLDPLHWPTILTPDAAFGWDLKFVLHRIVFALGVGLVALTITADWRSSAIVAAASPFLGVYTFRLNHPAAFTLTYAPWVLLAWFKLALASSRRQLASASTFLACSSALLLVAGTPKEAAITLLSVEVLGLFVVLLSSGSWRELGSRVSAAALAGAATVLITMPHWLLFLDALEKSFTQYEKPYVQFARGKEALGFFLGPLTVGGTLPGLHLLGLVLTAAAVSAPRKLWQRRSVLVCGIGAGVLVAIAFGALPASVIVRIPLLAHIGHIHDVFLTAALLPFLVFGAFGADVLLRANARRAIAVGVTVGVACWWLSAHLRAIGSDSAAWWVLLVLAPVATALPGCLYYTKIGSHRMLAWTAAAFAAGALVLPGSLHTESNIPSLDALLLQPRLRSDLDKDSPATEAIHRASVNPARTVGLDWTLFAGSQAFYELEGIGGADALEVRPYRELVDAAGIFRQMSWITMVLASDLPRLGPLLDMLNVSYVIASPNSVPLAFSDLPVPSPDRVRVGHRPSAWPRAFFVTGVSSYTDASDLLAQVAARSTPFAAVQASDREAINATLQMQRPSVDFFPARGYKLTVNTTTFAVRASGPGVAVLEETFLADDFRATLNGQRVPYFRVNHAFKAVAIPSAGDWEVKFEYRPKHWELSLAMACSGILLLAGFSWWARRPGYIEATLSEKPAATASS